MPPAAGVAAESWLIVALRSTGIRAPPTSSPRSAKRSAAGSRNPPAEPALCFSAARNARGSAIDSQTCGRKVARWAPYRTISAVDARVAAARGRRPRHPASTRSSADKSDTSIDVVLELASGRAAESAGRGTRRRSAFSRTSTPSGAPALERADAAPQLARLLQRHERGCAGRAAPA